MVNLNELLQGLVPTLANVEVTGMQLDSRRVQTNDIFVAIVGNDLDGRQFIPVAIESGAKVVLSQALSAEQHGQISYVDDVPVITFYQLDQKLSALAMRFYRPNAKSNMQIVGVTGTNGKSTVTHLMASWVALCGGKAAVMGTLGNGIIGDRPLISSENTTGDAISIAKQLAEFEQQGVNLVAMEVSSHGLHQHRVAAVDFTQAVFTNLSREHLDYHQDMQEYQDVKQMLFMMPNISSRIINSDDPVGQSWLNQHSDAVSFGLKILSQHRQMLGSDIVYSTHGLSFQIHWAGIKYNLSAPLLGEFNAQNLLAAVCGLLQLGYPLDLLLKTAEHLASVPGRMECLSAEGQPLVVVDYAHTPDALRKALMAARIHCQGKLILVFGCGGQRDKGKRPLMAQVAELLADDIILTDDNPRTESPQQIMQNIAAGLSGTKTVLQIHDRRQAIEQAFKQAQSQDLILIAGKGHEDYQLIGTQRIDFSDQVVAQALLNGDK